MRDRAGQQRRRSQSPLRSGFEIVEQVRVSPKSLLFDHQGGYDMFVLANDSNKVRYAFKLMSTDNEHFKFSPITGFLAGRSAARIHVLREVTLTLVI
ncbi:unnamed protein product [Meloidogyne enterolobii]|uniref:Uncharacterized protein n=1 Tax=Meloidogyne enterolobii TaxID=390850 RepID=A0ACB0ZVC6_MELEN